MSKDGRCTCAACTAYYRRKAKEDGGISEVEVVNKVLEVEVVNKVLSDVEIKKWDKEEEGMRGKKFDPNKVESVYVYLNPDEDPHVYDLATDERVDKYVQQLNIYPGQSGTAILFKVNAQGDLYSLLKLGGGNEIATRSVPVVQFLGEWNSKGSTRLRRHIAATPKDTTSGSCTCPINILSISGCQCGGK